MKLFHRGTTLGDAVAAYKAEMQSRLSESSQKAYGQDLGRFVESVGADRDVTTITADDVREFLDGRSAPMRKRMGSAIKALFLHLECAGVVALRQCAHCRADMPRGWRWSYCDATCKSNEWRNQHPEARRAIERRSYRKRRPMLDTTCQHCGESFQTRSTLRKYCGEACRSVAVLNGETFRRRAYRGKVRAVAAGVVVGTVTGPDIRAMLEAATNCAACDVELTWGNDSPTSRHVDHAVPIRDGGAHTLDNLRVLCRTCNVERKAAVALGVSA